MARTERQRVADQQLHEAVQEAVQAYGEASGDQVNVPGVLGPWLVAAVEMWFDEDGDPRDVVCLLHRGGSLPNHVALGLVRAADAVLVRGFMQDNAGEA